MPLLTLLEAQTPRLALDRQDRNHFVQAMEEFGHVERPQLAPSSFPALPEGLHSSIPSPEDALGLYEQAGAANALEGLQQLTGLSAWRAGDSRRDARSAMPFAGGESAGLERLQEILYGKEVPGSTALPGSRPPDRALTEQLDDAQILEHGTLNGEQEQDDGSSISQTDARQGKSVPAGGGADRQAANGQPGSAQERSADRHGDEQALIHSFKDMRMQASGVDNSAKLSAYLAAGCLSPRQVYWQAKDAAERHGTDTGHSTLIMHLVIRCEATMNATGSPRCMWRSRSPFIMAPDALQVCWALSALEERHYDSVCLVPLLIRDQGVRAEVACYAEEHWEGGCTAPGAYEPRSILLKDTWQQGPLTSDRRR